MAARMRTIEQAASWLQENDPGTALTKTAMRRLVTTGQLPSVRVGQKYLISLEVLEAFLQGDGSRPVIPFSVYKDERAAQ